ncbi:MAG: hypothetical protein QOH48_2302 [Actinomycetota bacterium]|jgi:hypothetical protein|nr:hypothetical protein [Actinomycetota bacterium]
MSGLAWVIVAVIVIVLILVAYAAWQRKRRTTLQSKFGPEYDRAVVESDSRRQAEKGLEARQKRHDALNLRELDPATRDRHIDSWRQTQARFVDAPAEAVGDADRLVGQVMTDRGYPMDNFEQRSEDISVDHPGVVENYRAAHAISLASDHGQATTEDLRQAMVHYRSLFETLLGSTGGSLSNQTSNTRSTGTSNVGSTGTSNVGSDAGSSDAASIPDGVDRTGSEGMSQNNGSAYPQTSPAEDQRT